MECSPFSSDTVLPIDSFPVLSLLFLSLEAAPGWNYISIGVLQRGCDEEIVSLLHQIRGHLRNLRVAPKKQFKAVYGFALQLQPHAKCGTFGLCLCFSLPRISGHSLLIALLIYGDGSSALFIDVTRLAIAAEKQEGEPMVHRSVAPFIKRTEIGKAKCSNVHACSSLSELCERVLDRLALFIPCDDARTSIRSDVDLTTNCSMQLMTQKQKV